MASPRLCLIPECNKPHKGHGLCNMHLLRMRRRGTSAPLQSASRLWIEEMLKHRTDECVIWPFHRNNKGYGQIGVEGKIGLAHRIVCQIANGEPPGRDHHAAHSCGNGHLGCVNPRHLSWKTPSQNEQDKYDHGTRPLGEDAFHAKLT